MGDKSIPNGEVKPANCERGDSTKRLNAGKFLARESAGTMVLQFTPTALAAFSILCESACER
jgi:hypothetical protein